MSTLSKNQAARRERVLRVAQQLAASGGYGAVQMRTVASNADVALGTLYRYFPSKEYLLVATMIEHVTDLAERLAKKPAAGKTPEARVSDVVKRATKSLQRDKQATGAMVKALVAAEPRAAELVREVSTLLTEIITHAARPGAPSERDATAARVLQQVWLASLVGWIGGVDTPGKVNEDLETATRLLFGARR